MNEPVRPEDLRMSDTERAGVQDRLRGAHDLGQLDLAEFDDRVRSVWAARTRAELVHPWWLWVAGPPGAVLAVLYAAGIGRPERE